MIYSPEGIQVTLLDSNGKSYTIDGFASDDFEIEQSWYRLCEVKEDGTHVVTCLDSELGHFLSFNASQSRSKRSSTSSKLTKAIGSTTPK